MKTISLGGLVSILVLSGLALASQSGEPKEHSSMMQEMKKDGKQRDHMDGMMLMMKMMDQCAAMMDSAHNSKVEENQKQ
jgi:hypothetical protein